ncbi:MAG: oxygen-independent coproporphyrinogen III oxidase [bacterium]|nr:oxygen-independent coproporphyrinogen III oxidase [Planctomycetota bacterium]HIL51668.1 oxygen-independent coproporphyrinogen III oxidase [Planctomycetota bacterium]
MSGQAQERSTTLELLKRFDRPGPRYTSYPTAVEFSDAVGVEDLERHLAQAACHVDAPLSVYAHLPFCAERCLFCGCHVIITPHKEKAAPYLNLLGREIELVAEKLKGRRKVSQLHLGGGTPTYYSPAELDALLNRFFQFFEKTEGAELAVECDPRVTSVDHIDALAAHGFNRISFGVQDFTPKVQQAIDRVQSVAETEELMLRARERGFRGINVDLIYGLPHQTLETFEESLKAVIALGPDRVAVYSFAFVPWVRGHQKQLDEKDFPSREQKFALFALARERFLSAGYIAIGMDHFARPDDELALALGERRLRRNFQGYAQIPAEDVIGLGISAIGDVRQGYFQNAKKISRYGEAIEAGRLPVERGVLLRGEDALRRALIHDLMCNFRVDKQALLERFEIDFEETFREDLKRLEPLIRDGLVRHDERFIEATPEGQLFVRNIAMCFDTYWREKHEQGDTPVFSSTV